MTTRRDVLKSGAALSVAGLMSEAVLSAALPPISPIGIASAAMGNHMDGMGVIAPMRNDSMAFIEFSRSLGAGGLQFTPTGDLKKLRARMEKLGMWYEGNAASPGPDGNLERYEQSLKTISAMGGKVARYVSQRPQGTSGRRYESFTSMKAFEEWREQANALVLKCLPLAERYGVKIALENHKDRLADEHADFLRKTSSEYLGALIDPGNNMSMLESPEAVCTQLAPYVLSVSMKDMAVAPYEEGFLLSEVRFGEGVTDQLALWKMLKAANPKLNCLEELITRDPLKVPTLTSRYWSSLPPRSADELAKHLEWVKAKATKLPYVEQLTAKEQLQAEADNNRSVLDWGRQHLV